MPKISWIHISIGVLVSLLMAIVSSFDIIYGVVIASLLLVVLPVVTLFYLKPSFGVFFTLIVSYFILGIMRFILLPLGILMDAFVVLLFVFMLHHLYQSKERFPIDNSLSKWVLVWIIYNILQLVNPFAESKQVWIYAIRPIAITMLMYYISSKYLRDYREIKIFTFLILVLSSLLAAYGVFQEYNGLLPVEENWVRADPGRLALFFNWWRFRKFSFFSDPMTFGVTCAYSGTFALILSFGQKYPWWKKLVLLILAGLMFFSMVFSGTRTAYVMPVAGFAFYVLLNLNIRVIIFSSILFIAGAAVIVSPIKSLGPIDENNLERIRSAFMPTEDPSFNVRLKNQAFIQPYIQTHPIGGGIGSTGQLAVKFTPYTKLSQFQVDSGFVKIGVEQGTVGLLIYMILIFYLFKTGIDAYFLSQDPKVKNIISAILCSFFAILVGNYAQEVITMYPTSIIFYCGMGILVGIRENIKSLEIQIHT